MRNLYTAVTTVSGGRDGHVVSTDGNLEMDLRTPRLMGGSGEPGTNPEQLFAAGYAACFESAIQAVARRQKKEIGATTVTSHVTLQIADAGRYTLAVDLHAHIESMSIDDTLAMMQAAHEICPYSNATRGNVEVSLFAD